MTDIQQTPTVSQLIRDGRELLDTAEKAKGFAWVAAESRIESFAIENLPALLDALEAAHSRAEEFKEASRLKAQLCLDLMAEREAIRAELLAAREMADAVEYLDNTPSVGYWVKQGRLAEIVNAYRAARGEQP